jgi:hypothetical protein
MYQSVLARYREAGIAGAPQLVLPFYLNLLERRMSRGGFSSARLVEIWMFAAGINNDGRVGQYRKLENLRLCDNYEVRLSGELHTMLIAEK